MPERQRLLNPPLCQGGQGVAQGGVAIQGEVVGKEADASGKQRLDAAAQHPYDKRVALGPKQAVVDNQGVCPAGASRRDGLQGDRDGGGDLFDRHTAIHLQAVAGGVDIAPGSEEGIQGGGQVAGRDCLTHLSKRVGGSRARRFWTARTIISWAERSPTKSVSALSRVMVSPWSHDSIQRA